MSTKRIIVLSLPILIVVGGLAFANQGGHSSTADSILTALGNHIQALASKDSGIRKTEPAALLVKKSRRAAAPQGFKSQEDLEIEKSEPKGKPPAIRKGLPNNNWNN